MERLYYEERSAEYSVFNSGEGSDNKISEIMKALKIIKTGKAAESGGMHGELVKIMAEDRNTIELLAKFF